MKATLDMMVIGKHINMNATFKNVKKFNFRLYIAIHLMRLAGRIAPFNYYVETEKVEEKGKEG